MANIIHFAVINYYASRLIKHLMGYEMFNDLTNVNESLSHTILCPGVDLYIINVEGEGDPFPIMSLSGIRIGCRTNPLNWVKSFRLFQEPNKLAAFLF